MLNKYLINGKFYVYMKKNCKGVFPIKKKISRPVYEHKNILVGGLNKIDF